MAGTSQAREPEKQITVDLSQGDPARAVTRSNARSDIASQVRDEDERGDRTKGRTKTEQEIFKRMTRMQKNLTKQFDQKLADSEAEHQRELASLKQRYESGVDVSDRGGAAQLKDAHEKAMAELEKKLAEANEKGDSAEAAKITAQMIRADGEYHAKLTGTQVRRDATGDGAGQQQEQQRPKKGTGPTPAGSRFILANEDWWEDPEFEIEKAAASTIYLKLVNEEGFGNNDDETFKEVGKRLKAKFPDLPVMRATGKQARGEDDPGDDDDPDDDAEETRQKGDQQQQRGRAPAMRVSDRGAGNGNMARGNRRTLTAEEIKTMRNVGLNPDNDKDVLSFLKEAVALENSAR
jgi:hypothetical protein